MKKGEHIQNLQTRHRSLEKKSKSVCVLGAIVGQGLGSGLKVLKSSYLVHFPTLSYEEMRRAVAAHI